MASAKKFGKIQIDDLSSDFEIFFPEMYALNYIFFMQNETFLGFSNTVLYCIFSINLKDLKFLIVFQEINFETLKILTKIVCDRLCEMKT